MKTNRYALVETGTLRYLARGTRAECLSHPRAGNADTILMVRVGGRWSCSRQPYPAADGTWSTAS